MEQSQVKKLQTTFQKISLDDGNMQMYLEARWWLCSSMTSVSSLHTISNKLFWIVLLTTCQENNTIIARSQIALSNDVRVKLLVELLCQKGISQAKDSLWHKTSNHLVICLGNSVVFEVSSFNYNFWEIATLQANTDISMHSLKELEKQEGIAEILLS